MCHVQDITAMLCIRRIHHSHVVRVGNIVCECGVVANSVPYMCHRIMAAHDLTPSCQGNACVMTRRSLLRTQAPVSINAFLTLYANADHWDRSFAEDMVMNRRPPLGLCWLA